MSDASLWFETDYFEKFRCKGGACRNSCCENWQIAISMKEYYDLIGQDCSPELHHRLECAFRTPDSPSPEHFRVIAPNWLGKCPLHGEDGLCMLHKECGEGVLPEICRIYPRSLKSEGGLNQACCSGSCEAVIETLLDMDQLSFRFARLNVQPELNAAPDESFLETAPDCMRLIQNREHALNVRLGAICARLGAEIPSAEPQLQDAALKDILSLIEKLKTDHASLQTYAAAALERYAGGDLAAWQQDAKCFETRFPRWQIWFENILANHLLYSGFPCVDARMQAADSVHGLCAVYGLMRVIVPAHSQASGKTEDAVDAIAGIFRLAEHSPFYYNAHILLNSPLEMLAL